MFDVCGTCGGSGMVVAVAELRYTKCPACVGGRVVSESVIEEMAEALRAKSGIHLFDYETISDFDELARAASRVVLEHMEDESDLG